MYPHSSVDLGEGPGQGGPTSVRSSSEIFLSDGYPENSRQPSKGLGWAWRLTSDPALQRIRTQNFRPEPVNMAVVTLSILDILRVIHGRHPDQNYEAEPASSWQNRPRLIARASLSTLLKCLCDDFAKT